MVNEKRIMIIAGEASGDLHASNLVRAIRKDRPDVRFLGVGGSRMHEAGVELIFNNREITVTGFSEVLSKVFTVLRAFRRVREALDAARPDLLILIDFPDFNLRVGRAAAKRGVPILYYISPQVWAWRQGRIAQICRMVEKIVVILPFEAALYGDKGVFVGHPLLDVVRPSLSAEEARERFGIREGSLVVALLPGSRRNEVRQHLPVFLEAARLLREKLPEVRFLCPLASTIEEEEIRAMLLDSPVPIRLVRHHGYDAIALSDFAVAASGTATLETAILGVPMVIVYKMSRLSFSLAKRLVKVPHMGLINMVAGERIVPELVQNDVTPAKIMDEALAFLQDRARSRRVSGRLREAVSRLGSPGASHRAAQVVLECMGEKP